MNAARLGDRQTDEFIGMVRMALADGALDVTEAQFMLRWLESNSHAMERWPAKAIYPRLSAALADGTLSPSEESELLELLVRAIGSPEAPSEPAASVSARLPLTEPPPEIHFAGRKFCFTGRFYSGARRWCEDQVRVRGGDAYDRLTTEIDYLVIGQNGSLDWLHSTHGRKIEAAIRYNESGKANIAIVGEEQWASFLPQPSG